ncbi:MAG: terpene cyclase/mutase family protein, partial [Planctomycetales bacterium]|nr:terpene cyclase/mutase family protein [Planctomycetales bacterium]
MPRFRFVCAALTLILLAAPLQAAESTGASTDAYGTTVSKAIVFLTNAQAEDGSWSGYTGPAVTSMATAALLRHGRTPSDPVVSKAIDFILKHAQDDGGIYLKGSNHRNYETCLSVMALSAANADGRHDKVLASAERFLKKLQWDSDEGQDQSSMSYGGAGYGSHSRPDLSNTSFLVDALKQLGAGPEDEAMQKALVFVSRCQNLETEHNPSPHAAQVNDGGFYYTVAAGGSSQAGETDAGGLRSYGSMT